MIYFNLSSPSQACGESKKGEQDSVEVEKPLQYAPQVLLQKLLVTLLNQMLQGPRGESNHNGKEAISDQGQGPGADSWQALEQVVGGGFSLVEEEAAHQTHCGRGGEVQGDRKNTQPPFCQLVEERTKEERRGNEEISSPYFTGGNL